jgi:hypothetical protein
MTIRDIDRSNKVLAREARFYRRVLRELILSVYADLHLAEEGSPQAVASIRSALQEAERVGWPGGGMSAKRPSRTNPTPG